MSKSTNTSIPVSYQFQDNNVRVIDKDGEFWFIAKDACDVLDIKNSRQALSRLDDDEKDTVILNDGIQGNPEKAIVNEFGLYNLILSSRKKSAKEFKRWVTHEILPSIRKTGSYSVNQQPQLDAVSTKEDREPLTNLVNTLVSAAPLSYRDVWHLVKAELKTAKAASEFTVDEVHHALKFVQEQINLYTTRFIPRENDTHAGIITDMAVQGVLRFSLVISIGENVTKDTKLVMRQFLAHIDLTEQTAIKPYGATFSLAKR